MVPLTKPRYVTSVTRLKSAAEMRWKGAKMVIMALLTQMSIGPNVSSIAAATLATAAASAMSTAYARARPPANSISRTVESAWRKDRDVRASLGEFHGGGAANAGAGAGNDHDLVPRTRGRCAQAPIPE